MSISLSKLFFLIVFLPLLWEVPEGERLQAEGIWARGDTVLLFVKVRPCTEESVLPSAQILASMDRGRSWNERGPRLEGKDFSFIYENRGQIWLAGFHTAEFGAEPFILVPTDSSLNWNKYTIYEGPAYLEGIAFQTKNQLIARVRHINVRNQNWKVYLHQSIDGGRSWRQVGRSNSGRRERGIAFKEIEMQTADWRIVDAPDGSFAVEHRELAQKSWMTVSQFPLKRCRSDQR